MYGRGIVKYKCTVREIFEYKGNRVVVVESKEFIISRFKIKESQVKELNIDTRVLINISKNCVGLLESEELSGEEIDYVIYVYNYEEMEGDSIENDAILAHELGHITYSPGGLAKEIE